MNRKMRSIRSKPHVKDKLLPVCLEPLEERSPVALGNVSVHPYLLEAVEVQFRCKEEQWREDPYEPRFDVCHAAHALVSDNPCAVTSGKVPETFVR